MLGLVSIEGLYSKTKFVYRVFVEHTKPPQGKIKIKLLNFNIEITCNKMYIIRYKMNPNNN